MAATVDMLVCRELGGPYEIRKAKLGTLRDDELLVRIIATGGTTPVPLPLVGGHEGAGVVEQIGSQVEHIFPGDHVLLSFSTCGDCATCKRNMPAYCTNIWKLNFLGTRTDGTKAYRDAIDGTEISSHFFGQSSFAKKAIVRARSAILVAPDLPLQTLCILGCTLQTGAGTVLNQLQPPRGSSIAVFGAGAVGISSILAALLTPNLKIIAVDVLASKLHFAKMLGAHHTVNSSEKDLTAEILALTGGFGVERALDTTGNPEVIKTMLSVTAPGGTAASVGAPKMGTKIDIEPAIWITRGVSYIGVHQGSSRPQEFIPRLIQLWAEGHLPVEKMITKYSYTDIERAKSELQSGLCVKAVLLWDEEQILYPKNSKDPTLSGFLLTVSGAYKLNHTPGILLQETGTASGVFGLEDRSVLHQSPVVD
ncbi:S-glutathione dehydrogenase [Penicillium lagena]|uniref:S-glutathione dehydrogenase n=1 Tax=Penicillium lagena TaxID=94218 RepID=UPI0025403EFB|nr:S-glutathione dehydrogenase [Penicillium lagena]KAJ5626400.1 S-glutathione dehydrogenase [Penicillium lagena]